MTWIPVVLALVLVALFAGALLVFAVTWYGQTTYAATRRWKAINRAHRRSKTCANCEKPGVTWQTVTSGFIGNEPPGWWFCTEHTDRQQETA